MKEKIGQVFSFAKEHQPIPGCTVSKMIHEGENGIIYFSLAKNTDISAELFPYHKLLIVNSGSIEVYGYDNQTSYVCEGESILTPIDVPVGMKTTKGAVYTEIEIRRTDCMNEVVKAGENFHFAKGGMHSVKATNKFKMALLLTLD